MYVLQKQAHVFIQRLKKKPVCAHSSSHPGKFKRSPVFESCSFISELVTIELRSRNSWTKFNRITATVPSAKVSIVPYNTREVICQFLKQQLKPGFINEHQCQIYFLPIFFSCYIWFPTGPESVNCILNFSSLNHKGNTSKTLYGLYALCISMLTSEY